MSSHTLPLAVAQFRCDANTRVNRQTVNDHIVRAAHAGARLVVLPELHNHHYFCQREDATVFDLAESVPGPATEQLTRLAGDLGIVIVGSVFERRAAGIYHNTAVVADSDGSLAGIYRKTHIPDDPGYHEKFYFTPGEALYRPIATSVGLLGILVCWDQWFPEAARLLAIAGAQVLIYPSAIGWDPVDSAAEKARQLDAWVTVQRGHAIANGLPVITANRVGHEADHEAVTAGIDFWGSCFVAGPQGEILARAPENGDTTLVTEIDMARSESVRRIWPFLRDRRIDGYGDLLQRYRD